MNMLERGASTIFLRWQQASALCLLTNSNNITPIDSKIYDRMLLNLTVVLYMKDSLFFYGYRSGNGLVFLICSLAY